MMHVSDFQKTLTLKLAPGTLINTGFFKHVRHPNFLGVLRMLVVVDSAAAVVVVVDVLVENIVVAVVFPLIISSLKCSPVITCHALIAVDWNDSARQEGLFAPSCIKPL